MATPSLYRGRMEKFMENNKKITGRNIVVNDFEIAPYDPNSVRAKMH